MKLNLVPAATGASWTRQGLKTFWRQPLAFISLFFLFIAVMSVASQVPLLGSFVAPFVVPFMTLGLMVASCVAQRNDTGKPTSPAMFTEALSALRARWRPLAVLGAISAVYFLLAVGLTSLIDGGLLARVYLLDAPLTTEQAKASDFQSARLLLMALNLPLSLAMWHAPALIHWHGVEPVKSLFFSLVALFRNFTAYAMFSLCWFGVFMAAGIALVAVTMLLVGVGVMAAGNAAAGLGGALMIGSALVLAAMSLASTWFTFRDTFAA